MIEEISLDGFQTIHPDDHGMDHSVLPQAYI